MDTKFIIAKALKKSLNPPALRNCHIDKSSKVCSKSELTSVSMDRYSYIGNNCFLVNTTIGSFCSIADRVIIGGATHPMQYVSTSPVFHAGKNIMNKNFALNPSIKTPVTTIKNDVWIGMGCFIKAGVHIGNGAVVGMGSVVTHDIPDYEIWAGNPARLIRKRFSSEISTQLINSKWWELDDSTLESIADQMIDPISFLNQLEKIQ